MASLEGWGLSAASLLVSAESDAGRALCVPRRQLHFFDGSDSSCGSSWASSGRPRRCGLG